MPCQNHRTAIFDVFFFEFFYPPALVALSPSAPLELFLNSRLFHNLLLFKKKINSLDLQLPREGGHISP